MAHHNIDCLVDTNPMAKEITKVSSNVKGTTAAVVAMKAAVVAAEKEGANHVCKNVNRGFFTLMHSQISQKIAAKKSRTDSLLIELSQQKRRLLEIKSTMERDYRRISARYGRIITGINKALKQRVYDLDRPVFDLCERDMENNNNRVTLMAGLVPVCQSEDMMASQQIAASVLKNNSLKAISRTRDFLYQLNQQKQITNRILLNRPVTQNAERVIPVIYCSSTIDRNGNESTLITVPQETDQLSAQSIENEVGAMASQLQWQDAHQDEMVQSEFNKLVAQSSASSRVKDLTTSLFKNRQSQNI